MKNLQPRARSTNQCNIIAGIIIFSLLIGSGITTFKTFKDTNEMHNDIGLIHDKIQKPIAAAPTDFVSRWNTSILSDGSSGANQIALPLAKFYGQYSFTVDWGDNSDIDTITEWNQIEVNHTYSSEGIYSVIISGKLQGWRFNNLGDKLKLLEISQWGDFSFAYSWGTFDGCENLNLTATDAPEITATTYFSDTFRNCDDLGSTGNMSNWDVSCVQRMDSMFYSTDSFNQDISNWNVSSVTDMSDMFLGADSFNQDIGKWNVSSVTDMSYMFCGADSFVQKLDEWNVSGVTNMSWMFYGSDIFNLGAREWDVSSVTDMSWMFGHIFRFNTNLSEWDVSNVTNMCGMFYFTYSFNSDIGRWNVSKVTDMSYMFFYSSNFNQDIGLWDVSSVTDMSYMFSGYVFDQDIGSWNVSSVTNMEHMCEIKFSIGNYNSLLMGWAQLSLQSGVIFDSPRSLYGFSASDSRQSIIDDFDWVINDDGMITIYPPIILTVKLGDGVVLLVWEIPSNLSIYHEDITSKIYRSDSNEGPFTNIANNTGLMNGYSDLTVVNGQTYYYCFQIIVEGEPSEYSEIVSATPYQIIFPDDDDQTDDDTPTDDTKNGEIPGFSFGIIIISIAITVFLIQKRKISKPWGS
ncbi:MAG: BspA family leucine-rich repeat surface protein [Promethearchaeota archaeon]